MSISNPQQKAEALINDLSLLVAQTKENLRARGHTTVREFAFQPAAYPASYEVYEAIFNAAFAAGETHGKADLANKVLGYLKK